jgi:hypothetical protein
MPYSCPISVAEDGLFLLADLGDAPCGLPLSVRARSGVRRRSAGFETDRWGSLYVLMAIETLGDALATGRRAYARCPATTRSTAKCRPRAELDLETLVWTRGRDMLLAGSPPA